MEIEEGIGGVNGDGEKQKNMLLYLKEYHSFICWLIRRYRGGEKWGNTNNEQYNN